MPRPTIRGRFSLRSARRDIAICLARRARRGGGSCHASASRWPRPRSPASPRAPTWPGRCKWLIRRTSSARRRRRRSLRLRGDGVGPALSLLAGRHLAERDAGAECLHEGRLGRAGCRASSRARQGTCEDGKIDRARRALPTTRSISSPATRMRPSARGGGGSEALLRSGRGAAGSESSWSRAQGGHAFLTETEGTACGLSKEPYVSDCDYDQARRSSNGSTARSSAVRRARQGKFIVFDQIALR